MFLSCAAHASHSLTCSPHFIPSSLSSKNEPDVLAPFLFSLVLSDAWRTQFWVRWILDTYYQLVPDGVPGNDDFGELNAWAVWACLGVYPLAATAEGSYILTTPCFKNVTLALPAAEARHAGYAHAPAPGAAAPAAPLLNIIAHNFSVANIYILNASLNGAPCPTPVVTHAQLLPPLRAPRPGEDPARHAAALAAGAGPSTLEFWLTDHPVVWGSGGVPAQAPQW